MLNEKDRDYLKRMIDENFSDLTEEEREKSFQKMIYLPDATVYVKIVPGNNVARVGVKYKLGETTQQYYLRRPEYDLEIYDL